MKVVDGFAVRWLNLYNPSKRATKRMAVVVTE